MIVLGGGHPGVSGTSATGGRYSISQPLTVSQTTQSFTITGGSGSVNVTAQGGCTWTATSNANWLTITSGGSGAGNNPQTAAGSGAGKHQVITAVRQIASIRFCA